MLEPLSRCSHLALFEGGGLFVYFGFALKTYSPLSGVHMQSHELPPDTLMTRQGPRHQFCFPERSWFEFKVCFIQQVRKMGLRIGLICNYIFLRFQAQGGPQQLSLTDPDVGWDMAPCASSISQRCVLCKHRQLCHYCRNRCFQGGWRPVCLVPSLWLFSPVAAATARSHHFSVGSRGSLAETNDSPLGHTVYPLGSTVIIAVLYYYCLVT